MHRTVERMLRTNPEAPFAPMDSLAHCIHAAMECAQVCTGCADACVAEQAGGRLDRAIRLSLDCADVCTTAYRMLSRQQSPDLALVAMMVELCAAACESCAIECAHHAARFAHCQVAAAACQRAYSACRMLMGGHASLLQH